MSYNPTDLTTPHYFDPVADLKTIQIFCGKCYQSFEGGLHIVPPNHHTNYDRAMGIIK